MIDAFSRMKVSNSWSQKTPWEKTLFLLKIYFVLFTTSGFTMFICEEAIQTANFGVFAYSSAKDGYGMQKHITSVCIPTHTFANIIINSFGYLNPLMQPAYKQFLIANEGYIKSARKQASYLISTSKQKA